MIYFIARTATPNLVKIGKTEELEDRLTAIAGSFEGGIDLLATCAGDKPVETFLHMLFLTEHVEGEWFQRTAALDFIIGRFAAKEQRHFGPRTQRQVGDAADEDLKIAVDLLRKLLPALAGFNEGIALAQERAFKLLHAANSLWTRRRVRALWEASATRVAHYEIRNLESALALAEKIHGPQMDAYRSAASGVGRGDCARTRD
jgi:hypothetical protein